MTEKQRYDKVFMETFNLDEKDLNDTLIYDQVSGWDSVGHMSMMAALETEFDIMMETEDIIDFSSYKKGLEILEKYGVHAGCPLPTA